MVWGQSIVQRRASLARQQSKWMHRFTKSRKLYHRVETWNKRHGLPSPSMVTETWGLNNIKVARNYNGRFISWQTI